MSLLPSRVGWTIVLILFIVAGILLWIDINRWRAVGPPGGNRHIGSAAPDARVVGLDGKPAALRNFYHHPVVLNFFATWCIPCKAELALLEQRYESGRRKGLIILGLDEQEEGALVGPFVKRSGVTYPVVLDRGDGSAAFDVNAIPTSVFIDASGTVRAIHIGELSAATLDAELAKILP